MTKWERNHRIAAAIVWAAAIAWVAAIVWRILANE